MAKKITIDQNRFNNFLDKFTLDMQRQGLFVSTSSVNIWEPFIPSIYYNSWVGTERFLPEDNIRSDSNGGNFPLRKEGKGFYLNLNFPYCIVSFRADAGKKKDIYELVLPSGLEKPVTRLDFLLKGAHLLNTIESWAQNNGRLDPNYSPDKYGEMSKIFFLNI